MGPLVAVMFGTWLTPVRGWWAQLRRPRSFGQRGERAAARFLKRLGYKIVFQAGRASQNELDIVAVDRRTVVFVEVKTRRQSATGSPLEAVDTVKQRRIAYLATAYLKRHRLLDCSARFDVIAVVWPENSRRPEIQHIKHAFESGLSGQMF